MFTEDVIRLRNGELALENEGKYWTEKDRELLMERFYAGDGISELSLSFQRSERAVVQQINKAGGFDNISKKRNACVGKERCYCGKCPLRGTPSCPNRRGRQAEEDSRTAFRYRGG